MSKKEDKSNQFPGFDMDNFIDYVCQSSPEEINEFIRANGKPIKLRVPIIFFNDK